uniref:Helix-turn-helix domain-containing protein n=1 Tax=Candidatus Endohaliclona renieramycinifaciens TaxID=2565582 RepID=A0A4D6G5X1_9GAMM|nr:hypothetical protein [Candidatus Endohaliclona renieramycinifaciens]
MGIHEEETCTLQHYRQIREMKEYRLIPFSFREYLGKDKRLSQTAKFTWIVLSDYSTFDPEFKVCMSSKVLASKIGKSKETARRALQELKTFGYIKTNLDNKSESCTTIWIRFPKEFVEKILIEIPNRSTSKRSNFKLIPTTHNAPLPKIEKNKLDLRLEPGCANTPMLSAKETGIKSQAQLEVKQKTRYPEFNQTTTDVLLRQSSQICVGGSSKMSHINTNNITNQESNKTYNNTNTDQIIDNTQPQTLLEKLLAVERLFKKFVKRANILQSQGLELASLKIAMWKPYSTWERHVLQAFFDIQKLSTKPWSASTAMTLKDKYDSYFQQAKASGLSPLQAARQTQLQFSNEQIESMNILQKAFEKLTDYLNPPPSASPESMSVGNEKVISLKLQPKISLSQAQASRLVKRLQIAYRNQQLQGESAKTDLNLLAEQLIFHAEHWVPNSIEFKTIDERVNIAINVALKRMKAGSWSAPYGWIKRHKQSETAIINP